MQISTGFVEGEMFVVSSSSRSQKHLCLDSLGLFPSFFYCRARFLFFGKGYKKREKSIAQPKTIRTNISIWSYKNTFVYVHKKKRKKKGKERKRRDFGPVFWPRETPCPRPREEKKSPNQPQRGPLAGHRSPPIAPPHETVIKTLPPTVVSSAVAIRLLAGLFFF